MADLPLIQQALAMTTAMRLAIVDPDDSSRESLKGTLLHIESIWLEADCSRYDFFADVVEESKPDIGLVNLDSGAERAIELIEDVTSRFPEVGLIVTSHSSDGQLILRAIRAGAKEFIGTPIAAPDLVAAIDRIGRSRPTPTGTSKKRTSHVVAVCGSSGGVGSTSIAVNLATVLSTHAAQSVALVDLDLALGDTDVFLDMIPEHTIMDLVQNSQQLDLTFVKRSMARHQSGVSLLPRPIHLDENRSINPNALTQIMNMLRATYQFVIVDLSKSYTDLDIEAMHLADSVLLVTQLDLPSLRNVVRILVSLRDLKLDSKVQIIVNRVGLDSGQISLKRAKETLGREIFWQIPNDYGVMVQVRNNGVPLMQQAPKAAITASYKSLADRLLGKNPVTEEAKPTKKTWLSFLTQRS